MHICHVSPYDLSRPGGVLSHITGLSAAQTRAGHRVTLVGAASGALPQGEVRRVGTIRRLPLWGTVIDWVAADRQDRDSLRHFFRTDPPDILHFHTPWNPILGWQVWRLADRNRTRIVATFHDTPPSNVWGRFLGRWVMPAVARLWETGFDAILSVSETQRSNIDRWLSRPVIVVPNGIDTDWFRPDDPRRVTNAVLFLGRLEPRKGFGHLVRIHQRLRRHHPDLELWVAGDGPDARLASGDGVRMFGQVDEPGKRRLLQTCTLMASPALYGESFGIVLLEAMAAGAPVVGFGNPGYRTLAAPYAEENFPDPGDEVALEAVIHRLLTDQLRRAELTQRGLESASAFDWRILAVAVEDVYRTVAR